MLAGVLAKEITTLATQTALPLCLAVLDLTVLTTRLRFDYDVN